MTIGSLFSGIGGLELGLERAGLGPTLWQVERDPKCRQVLATHWPEATRYEDVRAVGSAQLARVDTICGGFPCQDVSSAGRGAGLAGARSGLWYEFARIVEECRPRFVVVENVTSGAARWVDAVRGGLERLGYATLPIPVSASDLGAPHRRARVFIVAAATDYDVEDMASADDGGWREAIASGGRADAANSNGKLLRNEQGGGCRPRWLSGWGEPDSHRGWTSEPDVARVVSRLPGRVDRERALGNSVVPQCAEVVGHVIRLLSCAQR